MRDDDNATPSEPPLEPAPEPPIVPFGTEPVRETPVWPSEGTNDGDEA